MCARDDGGAGIASQRSLAVQWIHARFLEPQLTRRHAPVSSSHLQTAPPTSNASAAPG